MDFLREIGRPRAGVPHPALGIAKSSRAWFKDEPSKLDSLLRHFQNLNYLFLSPRTNKNVPETRNIIERIRATAKSTKGLNMTTLAYTELPW